MPTSAASEGEHIGVSLACGPGAAAIARRAVVGVNGAVPANVRDDLLLLVTELVTNAVRHAGAAPGSVLELTLDIREGRVRAEVADPGHGFAPEVAPPERGEAGGWGLYLLNAIADDWGVVTAGSGTRVWFELGYAG